MKGSPRRQAASWTAGPLIGLVIGLHTIGGAGSDGRRDADGEDGRP